MLSKSELERYSRQILVFGRENQIRLKESTVLVLGAGGIGSALLPYLAASGVGNIFLMDPDVVEQSNLSRQILYSPDDVGALKGPLTVEKISTQNPDIRIEWLPGLFREDVAQKYLQGVDLVLEGTDDIYCKFLVSDLSRKQGIAGIIGSLGNVQGHVFPVSPQSGHACYRCLFEAPPKEGELPTCATEGILSPLPGVVGSLMAYLAVKYLTEKKFEKKIYLVEKNGWRTIPLKANKNCSLCSKLALEQGKI